MHIRSRTLAHTRVARLVPQVTPNGKEILKNINLGMYLGAKIGVLGANGAGKSSLMRILAQEVS